MGESMANPDNGEEKELASLPLWQVKTLL